MLQESSSLGPKAEADKPQAAQQPLEAVHKEQELLKKQLVELQCAEAAHLQTISEACFMPRSLVAVQLRLV